MSQNLAPNPTNTALAILSWEEMVRSEIGSKVGAPADEKSQLVYLFSQFEHVELDVYHTYLILEWENNNDSIGLQLID